MRRAAILLLACLCYIPTIAQANPPAIADDQGLSLTSENERYHLRLGAHLQLLSEYRLMDDGPTSRAAYVQRLRPDIQGHAHDPDLTFRLMLNLARSPALHDGWVNYQFSPAFNLRLGQFLVPFNWEFDLPPTRHLFATRSAANNGFQWPTGRDLGLMAHGAPLERFQYAVGIFNGGAINAGTADPGGPMASARLVFEALGSYAKTEVPLQPTDDFHFAVGTGAMLTLDNRGRDWQPQTEAEIAADVWAITGDIHLRYWRASLHLSGFYRHVDLVSPEVLADGAGSEFFNDFRGAGLTGHLAFLAIPERLIFTARVSASEPNENSFATHRRQALLGAQILHLGHRSKFVVQGGRQAQRFTEDQWLNESVIRLQYQFML